MRIIAIATAFILVQVVTPAVASNAAPGLWERGTIDLSAAKKKAPKKKKKEKVQYMRSAS